METVLSLHGVNQSEKDEAGTVNITNLYMKKVLVIGGGGREHAIVDALSRSPQVGKIYCAPGNAGISAQAECVSIKDTDVEGLKAFALEMVSTLPLSARKWHWQPVSLMHSRPQV